MGKRNATRVTAADIAKMGDLSSLIKKLVKQAAEGDNEAKESAAATLSSLAFQNQGQHQGALYKAGAVPPLVELLKGGSTKAQQSAASALHALLAGKPRHQEAILDSHEGNVTRPTGINELQPLRPVRVVKAQMVNVGSAEFR